MANSNEITLTRALYGLTKNTAKIALIFLLISAILISITYNDADPSFNTHTLDNNTTRVLYSFHVSDGDSKLHIGYFVAEDTDLIDYIDFRIQQISGDLFEDVIISLSTQYYRDLNLDSGDYRVVATLKLKSYADLSTRIDIVSGYGNVNLVLAALSILTLVIGAISMGLFFAVLPFTVFVLILNGFRKPKSQYQPEQRRSKTHRTSVSPSQINEEQTPILQPQPIQSESEPVYRQGYSKPYRFDPNSFTSKLTAKDWTWLIIALISFIGFIFAPDTPLIAFSIIITGVVIYSVSEREKTKYRILVLLKNNPETSVAFLSRQLGKKDKYVTKILQIMILDEAMPIVMNLYTKHVKVIGPLDPYIEDNQRIYQPLTPTRVDEGQIHVQEPEHSYTTQQTEPSAIALQNEEITTHCTACGEGLIGNPKYCYICGQKTI